MAGTPNFGIAGNISSDLPAYLGFWCEGFGENDYFRNLEVDGNLKQVDGLRYSGPVKVNLVSPGYTFEQTVTLTATLNYNTYHNDYFSINFAAENNPTLGGLHGLLYTDSYTPRPSILKDGQGHQFIGNCNFIELEDQPR